MPRSAPFNRSSLYLTEPLALEFENLAGIRRSNVTRLDIRHPAINGEFVAFHSSDHLNSRSADEHVDWLTKLVSRPDSAFWHDVPIGGGLLTHYEKDLRQQELGVWLNQRKVSALAETRFPMIFAFRNGGGRRDPERRAAVDIGRGGRLREIGGYAHSQFWMAGPDLHFTSHPWWEPGDVAHPGEGSGILDPQDVGSALGIGQGKAHYPRNMRAGRPRSWRLDSSDRCNSQFVEDHIRCMLELLVPRAEAIHAYLREKDVWAGFGTNAAVPQVDLGGRKPRSHTSTRQMMWHSYGFQLDARTIQDINLLRLGFRTGADIGYDPF